MAPSSPTLSKEQLPTLPSKWRWSRIGNLVDPARGICYGIVQPGKHDPSGIPMVNSQDINNGMVASRIDFRVAEKLHRRFKRSTIRGGEILLTLVGANFGRVAIAPSRLAGYNCSRAVGILPVEESSKYVMYCLRSSLTRHFLDNWANTTAQPTFNLKDAANLPIPLPPLPEQKAIAHVLGSLDDRIELNLQMNETLESMAQTLFKSWFVDFDPVIDNALASGKEIPAELSEKAQARATLGDKRRPLPEEIRALFPDEFTYSDELGWIPKGWEVGPLTEIALLKTSTIQPKNEPETVWTLFSIPAFDKNQLPNKELGHTIKSGKYKVPPTAILASKLNPQFPRVWLPDVENGDIAICSTEFMPFVPLNGQERHFLYAFFSSSVVQIEIANRVTGSTGSRQRVKPPEIASMSILKPPKILREQFSGLAASNYSKVTSNIRIAQHLGKLRDTLLPKLLSGEIRIPDAEKMVEELAL